MSDPSKSLKAMQAEYDDLTKRIKLARRANKRRDNEMFKRRCEIVGAALLKALDDQPDETLALVLEPLIDRYTVKAGERRVLGLKPQR